MLTDSTRWIDKDGHVAGWNLRNADCTEDDGQIPFITTADGRLIQSIAKLIDTWQSGNVPFGDPLVFPAKSYSASILIAILHFLPTFR